MADPGPAAGFTAADPFGLGTVGGVPGAGGQLMGGGVGGVFSLGNYAQPGSAGPAGGLLIQTGPTDMGAAFSGGSVAGLQLSTSSARKETNALASFVSYFSAWRDGWEQGIKPGSLVFSVKNIVLGSALGSQFTKQDVVEQGGVVRESLTSAVGQRMTVADIPTVNWLLEESARTCAARRRAASPAGVVVDPSVDAVYSRRSWAYVDREADDGTQHHDLPFTKRFVALFGRHPMLEVNRGPAYDDNPLGGYDPASQYTTQASKRARGRDHPHLLASPVSDGHVCETPNIWGYAKCGDKLALRLHYYDARLAGENAGWDNPYQYFMTPDGRRAAFDRTTDTGFLQLVPCVYSRYGGDAEIDPEGSYCLPHRTTPFGSAPRPTDLDWRQYADDGATWGYQTGLEIFVGTVKEEPQAFDITNDMTPLRNQAAYQQLPKVRILFGK